MFTTYLICCLTPQCIKVFRKFLKENKIIPLLRINRLAFVMETQGVLLVNY